MAARTYIVGRLRSAHHSRDMILRLSLLKRNNMSFDLFAVYDQLFNAFLYTVRVLDVDVVAGAAEGTCKTEVAEALRDARIDTEAIVFRLYAQDRLARYSRRSMQRCRSASCFLPRQRIAASRPATIWE